jgi:SAM-dependent methyltransferase
MSKPTQEIFEDIYDTKKWLGKGEGSGLGSDLQRCKPLIRWLTHYTVNNSIQSIVDIGCGDLQWIPAMIERTRIKYTGIDCVSRLIESHRKQYETMTFLHSADLSRSVNILPSADMYFIKDVFQHWPTDTIAEFVKELKLAVPPGAHILICDDDGLGRGVLDIRMGEWLPLHETTPPLNCIPHTQVYTFSLKGEGFYNKIVRRLLI